MRAIYKRAIAMLLSLAALVGMLPLQVFASGSSGTTIGDGAGSGNASTSSLYTWDSDKIGLRISVVNNSGEVVTTNINALDVVWSSVPSNSMKFDGNKFQESYTGGYTPRLTNTEVDNLVLCKF